MNTQNSPRTDSILTRVSKLCSAALASTLLVACGSDSQPGDLQSTVSSPAEQSVDWMQDMRTYALLATTCNKGHFSADTSDIVPVLVRRLGDGQRDVLRHAKRELADEGERAIAPLGVALASWSEAQFMTGPMCNALGSLRMSEAPGAHDLLMRYVTHSTAEVRVAAAKGLVHHSQPQDYELLQDLLHSVPPGEVATRDLLLAGMANADSARMQTDLAHWMQDDLNVWLWVTGVGLSLDHLDERTAGRFLNVNESALGPALRAPVLALQGSGGDEQALQKLHAMLLEGGIAERSAALLVLGPIGREEWAAGVLVAQTIPEERSRAAAVLGTVADQVVARDALRLALNDLDRNVRIAAFNALLVIGDPVAVDRALALLDGSLGDIELASLSMREAWSEVPGLADRTRERLLARIAEDRGDFQRIKPRLQALGTVPGKASAVALLELIPDNSPGASPEPVVQGLGLHRWLVRSASNAGPEARAFLAERWRVEADESRRMLTLAILVVLSAWLLTSTLRGTGRGSQEGEPPPGAVSGDGLPELTGAAPRAETAPATADAEPTPSWAITGRVLDPQGRPLPGARVRATTRRGQVRDQLPSVHSDASGTFRLDLAPLARGSNLVRATAVLTVFAEAEGHLPSEEVEYYLSNEHPGTSIALDLRVGNGGTVLGRVVDAAGTPLPAASAGILYRGHAGHAHFFMYTEPDGRFRALSALPGPHVAEAEWGGHRGETAPFDVRGEAVVIAPDVVVPVTAAFIEGVVLRPDGTPGPRLEIVRRDEEPVFYDLGYVVAVSDEAGRFRFAAPSGTIWRVGVDTRSPRDSIKCKAGGPAIRVTIPPCRLVVRVVAEDGTPLPGTLVDYMAWRAEDRAARDALLQGKTTQEQAGGHTVVWEESEIPTADGTETSYVDPDTVWFFSARVPGGVPTEATLDIGLQTAEAEITLTVRERLPSGFLALTCVRPDGSSIHAWSVEVETLAGTFLTELRPVPSGAPLAVPAGRVRLRVEPGADPAWTEGALPADSFLLPVVRTVDIPAGRQQSLRLPMRAGGRFRVSVAPDGRGRPRYGPADIRIRPRDGSEETVRGVSDWISVEGDPPQPGNGWVPGTTAVSAEPLPPGDYVLVVHHFALKPYEAPLRIKARETVNVVLAWDD